MNKQQLVNQFQKNKQEIARTSSLFRNYQEEENDKIRLIEEKSENHIQKEKERTRVAVRLISEDIQKAEEKAGNEIKELNKPIEFIEEIVFYLKTNLEKNIDITFNPRGKEDEKIETFYRDEFINLETFIVENDYRSRVNRFSLEVIGKTKFKDLLYKEFGMQKDYTCNTRINEIEDITIKVKVFQTKEAARNFYNAKKENIAKDLWKKYQLVKKKYLDYKNNYSLEDFKDLEVPRKVDNAILVFEDEEEKKKYCLLNDCWYKTARKEEVIDFDNASKFIEFNGEIYEYLCAKKELKIVMRGNTLFGRWLSASILPHVHGEPINKENIEKVIEILGKRANSTEKEISISYPKIKWHNEGVLEE